MSFCSCSHSFRVQLVPGTRAMELYSVYSVQPRSGSTELRYGQHSDTRCLGRGKSGNACETAGSCRAVSQHLALVAWICNVDT